MKPTLAPETTALATLKAVLDRLAADPSLSDTRKRDLRSAVISYAKLKGQPAAAIPLDLADIRTTLDSIVAAQAKVSRKRWSNLRSDLSAAIHASGLRPMLKTANLQLGKDWARLLARTDQRIRHPLLRFFRWANLRRIVPQAVDDSVLDRFITELESATLIRNLPKLPRSVALAWNALVGLHPDAGLRPLSVPPSRFVRTRKPWEEFPASFREDTERCLLWASVPDPLAEGARARPLAPLSLRLWKTHIHSAVNAAIVAGIPLTRPNSLASLVEPETFRALLTHLWREDGRKLSAYTFGVANTLIAVASEWVKAPADVIATLKALRKKLGTLPTGLTEKNKALLRKLHDPRLLQALLELPDKLWRAAQRDLKNSRRAFVDLQTALAIDILLYVPMRLQNLAALKFETHLHWPQGRRKPALLAVQGAETKNDVPLEFEIPTVLAERLQVYRNDIAPIVTGKRPDVVFVTFAGRPRCQAAIKLAIEKALLRHLGLQMTCHQFRHLAAKIVLDAHPGAYELVRQLLGHKNLKTTLRFYAEIDTKRVGRLHAELLMKARDQSRTRGAVGRRFPWDRSKLDART